MNFKWNKKPKLSVAVLHLTEEESGLVRKISEYETVSFSQVCHVLFRSALEEYYKIRNEKNHAK